jgi:hypothetical protein
MDVKILGINPADFSCGDLLKGKFCTKEPHIIDGLKEKYLPRERSHFRVNVTA